MGWITSVGRTRATVDGVVARAAVQAVSADFTRDEVIAPVAADNIVPPAGGDVIFAAQGEDKVSLGCAGDNVVFVGTLALAGVGVLVTCAPYHRWALPRGQQ